MKTEAQMKQELREWVLKKNGKIDAHELTDETQIIEQRIITSLQIMDLILYLEKITGKPVEIEQLKPGAFKNIQTIYQNFCAAQADASSCVESTLARDSSGTQSGTPGSIQENGDAN